MAERPKRQRTSTSNFGVGKRENHDASGFYERFGAPVLSGDDTVNVAPSVDQIWVHDARDMHELPDNSVALVVTSPPYFAGKAYEEELGEGSIPASYVDYLQMLTDVFAECARVLEPGGRIAVNVANLGRKPYRSLSADVTHILQDQLGLLLRGEIIWQKARGAGGNCAWGSFQSAKNPVLRDLSERVIVASKGRFDRARSTAKREAEGLPARSTIGKDKFLDLTLDVWEFPPESATRVGHPAPFPVELPERLIELYTFEGDLVVDPFMGSGSTGVAAVQTGRRFGGYDTDPAYAEAALERIDRARQDHAWEQKARADASAPLLASKFPKARQAEANEMMTFQQRASADGSRAQELAEFLLRQCGFEKLEEKKKFPVGVEANFVAEDAAGCEWIFDVSGAFSSSRPGLERTDTLWKALGKAAILRTQHPDPERPSRYVLLTTDMPKKGSAGHKALEAAQKDGLIWDVLRLDEPETVAELLHYASGKRSAVTDRRSSITAGA
ncbi:MAG: modification methylase [Ilumatobacteraceae bacterium]|nr:modification methylase [Ilumatobacteraceae bacterium]